MTKPMTGTQMVIQVATSLQETESSIRLPLRKIAVQESDPIHKKINR